MMISIVLITVLLVTNSEQQKQRQLNNRPIIGIVAQETSRKWGPYFPGYDSYIAASYVKWVEAAGARVVPIQIKKDADYYDYMIKSTNGILVPGGSASLNNSGYLDATTVLYEAAIKANNLGSYYPMWFTCLGFEVLGHLVADEHIRIRCNSKNKALPLIFTPEAHGSKLLGNLPKDVKNYLTNDNVTANYHGYCFHPEQFNESSALFGKLEVLSTNYDSNGLEFISTMEHTKYPFYGVQWHPEKNNYEFDPDRDEGSPHHYEAIRISNYFATFFVNEARRNNHAFPNITEETSNLIYHHKPAYSQNHTVFEQIYLF